ncbi:MAG: hypothetical protein AAF221_01360 [Pseudomonadota bacterium]
MGALKTLALALGTLCLFPACGAEEAPPRPDWLQAHDIDLPDDLGRKEPGLFSMAYALTFAEKMGERAPSLALAGNWSGYISCRGAVHPVEIDIAAGDAGVVTIADDLVRPGRAVFYQSNYRQAAATLERFDGVSQAMLTIKRDDRTAYASILISPSSPDTAHIILEEYRRKRFYGQCDSGHVARGDAAKAIAAKLHVLSQLAQRKEPIIQSQCEPDMAALRDVVLAQPGAQKGVVDTLAAISSAQFQAAFGEAYSELSAADLRERSRVFWGSCLPAGRDQKTKMARIALTRFSSAIASPGTYLQAALLPGEQAVIEDWARWQRSQLDEKAPLERPEIRRLAAAKKRYPPERYGAQTDFTPDALALGKESGQEDRLAQYIKRLEAAHEDFPGLIMLRNQAKARGDIDMAVPALALDHYMLKAAELYGNRAVQTGALKPGQIMAAWAQTYQDDTQTCPAKTPALCQAVSNAFIAPIEAIADIAAQVERGNLADFEGDDQTERTLAAVTDYARTFEQRYGLLMDVPPLQQIAASLETKRFSLQDNWRGRILKEIAAAKTTRAYKDIRQAYFRSGDLSRPDMAEVREAFDSALSQAQPFKDMPRADYLNALYNQEFSELQTLDRQALARLRPLLTLGGQQLGLYGDLADALTGKKRGQSAEKMRNAMRHMSVVHAVMGTYLTQYQERYKACQSKGDAVFTITTRNDYVTRDGFGNEVRRRPGWTTKDSYRIPARFRDQFEALFGAAKQNGFGQLLDVFVNDGNVARLRSGTRALMAKHACDSPEVQQFEWGLLAYADDVARRMEGRP